MGRNREANGGQGRIRQRAVGGVGGGAGGQTLRPVAIGVRGRLRTHHGRSNPTRRHGPRGEDSGRSHSLRGGVQVRRREESARGHGTDDERLLLPRIGLRHHQRRDNRRQARSDQGRYRHQGKQDSQHRQGGQSGYHGRGHAHAGEGDDRGSHHGRHRRGEDDRHGRGRRHSHSLHMPPAVRRRHRQRHHDHVRRRHRTLGRHVGHHLHPRPRPHRDDAPRHGRPALELRLLGKGQHFRSELQPRGRAPIRRGGVQIARGLGNHPQRHRRLPHLRGRPRRSGHHPHGHAQRERVRRRHPPRRGRSDHTRVPHGGSGRGTRSRHHQDRFRTERPAQLDQSHEAVHAEHHRRAPRHAHGVPSPRSGHSGGRGVRRVEDTAGDDRGGGHHARPGGAVDDIERFPGHGAGGRGHHPDLADRRQDEAAAGSPRGGRRRGEGGVVVRTRRRGRQRAHPAVHRQVHHQPRRGPRHVPPRGLDRTLQARRPRLVEALHVRRQARDGHQGRDHRLGPDGRSERQHPDPPAGDDATHVRGASAGGGRRGRDVRRVRERSGRERRRRGTIGTGEGGGGGGRYEECDEGGHGEE
mmetsp:Transcript_26143/g.47482  ORF Transcript_26143/g.47482 Transcript_26143/m.47482 type:complete len:582 (+) Transcript_26143:541-2286(+)